MSKLLLSISNLPASPTEKDIVNAVRRTFKPGVALDLGTVSTIGDVTYRVRKDPTIVTPSKVVTTASQARQWAADNGIALGKRGRIPATVLAQFETSAK